MFSQAIRAGAVNDLRLIPHTQLEATVKMIVVVPLIAVIIHIRTETFKPCIFSVVPNVTLFHCLSSRREMIRVVFCVLVPAPQKIWGLNIIPRGDDNELMLVGDVSPVLIHTSYTVFIQIRSHQNVCILGC
jgi:hypothetical protein